MIKKNLPIWALLSICSLMLTPFLINCSPKIALYDQYAYAQTTSLKVEALSLMDKGADSVGKYSAQIADVEQKLNKAYEYEKGRPHNEITTQMWELQLSPDKHLLGGFIKRWRDETRLNEVFIREEKKTVGQGFDLIAQLESAKISSDAAKTKLNQFQ